MAGRFLFIFFFTLSWFGNASYSDNKSNVYAFDEKGDRLSLQPSNHTGEIALAIRAHIANQIDPTLGELRQHALLLEFVSQIIKKPLPKILLKGSNVPQKRRIASVLMWTSDLSDLFSAVSLIIDGNSFDITLLETPVRVLLRALVSLKFNNRSVKPLNIEDLDFEECSRTVIYFHLFRLLVGVDKNYPEAYQATMRSLTSVLVKNLQSLKNELDGAEMGLLSMPMRFEILRTLFGLVPSSLYKEALLNIEKLNLPIDPLWSELANLPATDSMPQSAFAGIWFTVGRMVQRTIAIPTNIFYLMAPKKTLHAMSFIFNRCAIASFEATLSFESRLSKDRARRYHMPQDEALCSLLASRLQFFKSLHETTHSCKDTMIVAGELALAKENVLK